MSATQKLEALRKRAEAAEAERDALGRALAGEEPEYEDIHSKNKYLAQLKADRKHAGCWRRVQNLYRAGGRMDDVFFLVRDLAT